MTHQLCSLLCARRAHLLLAAFITRPLHPRLPPLIPNTALISIGLTWARTFPFPAALAFDAGGTGSCACGSSIANATSTALGTRQCGSRQRVHGTGEVRGPYFETTAPKSVVWWMNLTNPA